MHSIDEQEHVVELRHLQHFVAVAEHGTFTHAAASVHVVQSTLSVSIRSLERELGSPLFDRSTHHVTLTDAGRALLPEARRTLAAADAARDAVQEVSGGLRGSIRVGIMHSLGLVDLAGILTAFHRERPLVRIEPNTLESGSAELAAAVADGRLDVAFAAMPGDYPAGLDVTPLASEPMGLAAPPGHRLAHRRRIPLHELDGERFIDFPPGWGTRLSVDRLFAEQGLSRSISLEIADIAGAAELVRAGFGLAFFAPSLLNTSRLTELIRVEPAPEFSVSLITPRGRPLSAATRAFVELALTSAH